MRNAHLLLALFCLSLFSCDPEEVVKPQPPVGGYVFGGEGREAGFGLMEMDDGNILIVGAAKMPDQDDYDLQLTVVSPSGEEIASYDFRNPGQDEVGHQVVRTSNGFAVVGFQTASSNRQAVGKTWEFSPAFELLREQSMNISGGPYYSRTRINSCFLLPDGGLLLGWTDETGSYVMKLDDNFQLAGTERFETNYSETKGDFLVEMSGGGYMAFSVINNYSGDYASTQLAYFDAAGELQWANTSSLQVAGYSGNINAVTELSDGDLLAVVSFGTGEFYLARYDAQGNHLSTRQLQLTGNAISRVREFSDGKLLLGGNTSPFYAYYGNTQDNDFFLAEADTLGNVVWQNSFGGNQSDAANDLLVLNNTCYLVGTSLSYGLGESDNYLVIYNR